MNKLRLSIPLALGSLFLVPQLSQAADANTPPAEKPAPNTTELENRIRTLEARIHDLESQLDDRATQNNNHSMRQFRDRMKRDLGNNFDDMFDQMRRELEQGGFNFKFDFTPDGQMAPPRLNSRGFGMNAPSQERPRLGVQLQPLSDELRERFNNKPTQGAFVTSVVPDSPAEKAGLAVGDAIIKVDGKDVATAAEAIDAVRNAADGKLSLTVLRQNKEVTLTAELQAELSIDDDANQPPNGRWLRKGDLNRGPKSLGNNGMTGNGANGHSESKTVLKASALEVTDELATTLKLNDEQRKKMSDVLARQSQAASDEASAPVQPRATTRGGWNNLSLNADISGIIEKHVAAAETELKGTLNDEQLRAWKDYRATHNTIQFSRSMTIENGGTVPAPSNGGASGGNGF